MKKKNYIILDLISFADLSLLIKIRKLSFFLLLGITILHTNSIYSIGSKSFSTYDKSIPNNSFIKDGEKLDLAEQSDTYIIQNFKLNGTITDSNGQPLPGANILEKGTNNGVVSDFNGNYSIELTTSSAVIVVSYIGFTSQEISVNNQSSINVILSEDASNLDEVVIVGYGSQKRKDVTGSVSSVSIGEIEDVSTSRIDQAIIGKVAGMQIIPSTGEPGADPIIRIRGVGSISASPNPLFVVDGFPIGSIETLNPNDIESIDVLKDASATAIYGSRGANGVIIITTKRGKVGESTITFSNYFGWQNVEKTPKMMNAMQQAQYHFDGLRNRNLDEGNDISGPPANWRRSVPTDVLDVLEGRNTYDVDVLDVVLQTAPQSQYQLSATGGSENVRYAISGEYLNQEGLVLNSNFDRYSFRANLDAKLSDKITAKINLNPTYSDKNALRTTGNQGTGILGSAMATHNYYPLLDENGEYFEFIGLGAIANFRNPLAVANEYKNNQKNFRFLGNIELKYEIINGFNLKVMAGSSILNNRRMTFIPQLPVFFNNPPEGSDDTFSSLNWITETTLDYNKSFGKHSIAGLIGYTTQKERGHLNFLESNQFSNNLVQTLSAVGGQITNGTSEIYEWSLLSYLARLNYNYDSKYYLTGSIRTDGSSRFGKNKKYGVFPSVALSWRLSQEEFFKKVDFVNELKLRTSYGETGNNNIGNYQQFATIDYLIYPLGGNSIGGYGPERLSNPNLTWEKQQSINIGMDASFFDNRLSLTIDYFRSRNKDLLLNVNIPSITGFSNSLQNIGEVENKGWEFLFSTVNLNGQFKWTTNFNISTSKNKVVKLGPEGDPIFSGTNVTMIGQPIGMFYGLIADGIFLNQAELDKGPIYNPGANDESRLGDIRFKDVSGPDGVPDGIVNSFDNTIMGSPYPDFYYGMTNNFNYKNFNLSVSFQGVKGNQIYLNSRGAGNSTRSRVRGYASLFNYWKSEADPGDGVTPRPNDAPTGGVRVASSRYLDTGSYLRINNITLGYSLPKEVVQKINLKSVRFYINAVNPFLITDNTAFNPDVSNLSDPLRPGNESNDYPLAKSINFGTNISF
ncbi:SusC/RagA family TonB-linked outer membrane protein [Confluentibacter flavum]|uniref:SusC/RagA family TonB-linked outer membrane protein n=1 Tax=Confluentibacter flavum TaxID=1909700 RepID=A0A2N3HKA3_9FLAO|nr:TonB-dependent receptor [Confluentibacter flavum]PKQ45371.1 SusC/RagA family TonB-linked outer membrane protein [Confluentibacter flavum]